MKRFEFVGLANFMKLFSDKYIGISLKNNLEFTVKGVPCTVLLALLAAVLVFHAPKLSQVFRNVLFLPYITSSIAVATVWKIMYLPDKGVINALLNAVGIMETPRWLYSTSTSMISVVIVAVWQGFGYAMLFLLAGLQGIPQALYEAGEMDGAVGWKRFVHITFPLLTPTIFFVVVTNMINSFKVFDLILQMTEGGPANSTNVLVYRIYQEGILKMNMGYASAIAMLLFALVLILTIVQFILQKRWVFYSEEA